MTTFADLGLSGDILEALKDVGYDAPSPIQEQAIPPLLEGLDVIGQAQTGSGKTAAFGLPMLQYVEPDEGDVQGLVLTPTRELCIQVTQALRAYGKRRGVDVVAVFGGAPIRSQQAQLRAGGQVVVGTVGRVKDLIGRHSLVLHACRFVVLDEADEMLDLGFLEDVERILALTPSSRQTALFSATMPPEIRRLAEQYLYDPVTIKVKAATLTVDTVEQFALEVAPRDKTDALVNVLEAERPDQALVFVRTKIRADQLYRTLRDKGMNVRALHGDMTQGARDGVMISFKDGRLPLLVATDVAARGLDISRDLARHQLTTSPTSPDASTCTALAGTRTGRVGRSGRAITFYEPRQKRGTSRRSSATLGSSLAPLGQGREGGAHPGQRRRRAGTPSPAWRPTATAGGGTRGHGHRLRGPGRRAGAVRHHPRHHRGHPARRRVGPQRPRARALLLRRGSAEGRRAGDRADRRHRGPGARAAPGAGAYLTR